MLRSDSDERLKFSEPDWPANPWVNDHVFGSEENWSRRMGTLNRYLYLKPAMFYLGKRKTFEELRADPKIRLIAGLGLVHCTVAVGPYSRGNCDYWWAKYPASDRGQPAASLVGTMIATRTDGSAVILRKPDCHSEGYLSPTSIFAAAPFNCTITGVTGG